MEIARRPDRGPMGRQMRAAGVHDRRLPGTRQVRNETMSQ